MSRGIHEWISIIDIASTYIITGMNRGYTGRMQDRSFINPLN